MILISLGEDLRLCRVFRRSPFGFASFGAIAFNILFIKNEISFFVNTKMGRVRLRVREFAAEKGWTLKEVSERSGVAYSTVVTYAQRPAMAMTDFTAIRRLARTFDVMIEDFVEVVEE
ncbi:MAG TPA: helix-turn-helix transcriptional regulator [Candidatus Obscuribacterales bacterium]